MGLRQGYILALLVIFLLASIKFIALEMLVFKQKEAAVVINISGRQRMLSQRIAFFASDYMAAQVPENRLKVKGALIETVEEFWKNHNDLIEGNAARGLPVLNNKKIHDVYYKDDPALDALMQEYISSVHVILDHGGQGEASQDAMAFIAETGPDILLRKLNDIVKLHEIAAQNDVRFISQLQMAFWIVTIIVLLLEALFLFKPMIRRIEDNIVELEKREKKIQDQFHDLERFTFIASHDLHEPLRKIIGFTERLEKALEGKLDDKTKTYMRFVMSGAAHMRDLVSGLHVYASISATEDIREEIDANLAVKQALKAYNISEDNSKIYYQNLPKVIYNKEMLIRVFEELIGNALTYRKDEISDIRISLEEEEENWVFTVSDNGIGIAEKYFDRIFEMFQRLHRKEDIAGIGLGLAIVRKIVELHGGEVWVDSQEGQGAKFYFTVPKAV